MHVVVEHRQAKGVCSWSTIMSRGAILFISAHRERDIMAAALSTGACGYILKANVAHELLPAMAAIREGEQFISAPLAGRAR
jgi:DNA-binding NarL/FixJ family response regulator